MLIHHLTVASMQHLQTLVTVEYFEGSGDSMTTQRASSAPEKKSQGESQLTKGSSENEWVLDCVFKLDDEELGVKVHMTFGENGKVKFKVPYEKKLQVVLARLNVSKLLRS